MATMVKHHCLALKSVIAAATGIVVIYMMSILFELSIQWVLGFLLLSLVATAWMVVRILKDPYSTDKTFDDYFYQDREDIRRNGNE